MYCIRKVKEYEDSTINLVYSFDFKKALDVYLDKLSFYNGEYDELLFVTIKLDTTVNCENLLPVVDIHDLKGLKESDLHSIKDFIKGRVYDEDSLKECISKIKEYIESCHKFDLDKATYTRPDDFKERYPSIM